jgi:hypothetical protein
MSHNLPFSFEEFDRRDGKGAPSEKRGRERDDTHDDRKARHHHTIRVYCTCCDREIDLRTVHCGDCCDDSAARMDGGSGRGQRSNREKKKRGGGSKTYQQDGRPSSSPAEGSASRPRQHHTSQPLTSQPLTFVPEGYRQRADANTIRPLGAEEALAQSRALDESEADLIDLSIAPGIGE